MDLNEALKRIQELENDNLLLSDKIMKVEEEKDALNKKISKLEKEKLEYKNKFEELLSKVIALIEKVKMNKQRMFGVKSEKEKQVLNEAEATSTPKKEKNVISKRGRKPKVSVLEKFLDSIIEFKTVDITCNEYKELLKQDGYVKIGENSCHKIEYIPGHFVFTCYVVSQIKDVTNDVILPNKEMDPFPNSYLTPSFASEILIDKYLLGIPLYRMEQYWNKKGLPISRMNLANYVIDTAFELYPLYEAIKSHLLKTQYKILHADETTLRVLDVKNKDGNDNRKKSYMWVYATSKLDYPMIIYDFSINRSGQNPKEFLKDYQGYLEVDGYSGYNNIDNVEVCCCWAHARREYSDYLNTLPQGETRNNSYAAKLLKMINHIFDLDRIALSCSKDMEDYLKKRKENVKPVVDEYFNDIETNINGVMGKLKQAMQYSINLKDKLCLFLTNARIPLTNNLAERAIKPFVMCRKNFLFSKSVSGAEASAVIMSVIQTAKENGIEIQSYLNYVLSNMYKDKQSNIDNYLPWSETIQNKFSVIKKE